MEQNNDYSLEQNNNGAPKATEIVANTLNKATSELNTLNKAALALTKNIIELDTTVSPDSLTAADKGGTQLVLDTMDGIEVIQQGSLVKAEVEAITEEQRKKALQYQQDKAFYEKQILQKSRSAAAINDDYIKILHPTYRHKFVDAVSRYGTLAAGLRYMRDTYGVTVRADVLRRMRAIIPAFNAEIEDALAMYQGSLQMAMHQRAVEGVDKPVYDREGNVIAVDKVYSDSLLAKMVDVHTTEYKEAKQKESSKGNTINVQIIKDFHNYKKEQ